METRGWATPYRGPLVIDAGASIPSYLGLGRKGRLKLGEWEIEKDGPGASMLLRGPIGHPYRLPFAAAVAVVDLVDVIPIVATSSGEGVELVNAGSGLRIVRRNTHAEHSWSMDHSVASQEPFGDFTPGRFGWVLANVRQLERPVPMRGDLGVKPVPQDVLIKINEQLAA